VLPHRTELLGGQRSRLVEQPSRHAQLADIVQQAAAVHPIDVFPGR
jgi:hypothetical protein